MLRGGGTNGWTDRGISTDRDASTAGVTESGADDTAGSGMTKIIAVAKPRSSSWQQDIEHSVSPPVLSWWQFRFAAALR
jgi:hypothetical protein